MLPRSGEDSSVTIPKLWVAKVKRSGLPREAVMVSQKPKLPWKAHYSQHF